MMDRSRLSRRRVLIAGALAGAGACSGFVGIRAPGGLAHAQRAGRAFGTTVTMKVLGTKPQQLEGALDAAFHEIAEVERAASLFSASSALSRLNRDGAIEEAPAVLLEMLAIAREVSEMTGGAFDVTVQPLWQLYAQHYAAGLAPTSQTLAGVRDLIDYRQVAIEGRAVRLMKPGMALTLNGLAQGFATQRCLDVLRQHGIQHAFLDTGEIGAAGQREPGKPWTAGIADPRKPDALITLAHPLDGVLATSGDYASAFTPDRSVHHIFDPDTLRSPLMTACACVLARSGAHADALATAMMVMPVEDSLALARKLNGVEVLLIGKSGDIHRSAGFPAAT